MRFSVSRQEIVSEIKGLLSLGLPITVTQLLQVGYTTVAVIMTGRVGATELAAVGLGAALWIFEVGDRILVPIFIYFFLSA